VKAGRLYLFVYRAKVLLLRVPAWNRTRRLRRVEAALYQLSYRNGVNGRRSTPSQIRTVDLSWRLLVRKVGDSNPGSLYGCTPLPTVLLDRPVTFRGVNGG
jgi:hypothetical protein